MIECRAQMRAVDGADRTRAANVGRYFFVARFDFIAEDVSFFTNVTKGTGFQI